MSQSTKQQTEIPTDFIANAAAFSARPVGDTLTREQWIELLKAVNPHLAPHVAERVIRRLQGTQPWNLYQLLLTLTVVMGDLCHAEERGTVPEYLQRQALANKLEFSSWDSVGTWLPKT